MLVATDAARPDGRPTDWTDDGRGTRTCSMAGTQHAGMGKARCLMATRQHLVTIEDGSVRHEDQPSSSARKSSSAELSSASSSSPPSSEPMLSSANATRAALAASSYSSVTLMTRLRFISPSTR